LRASLTVAVETIAGLSRPPDVVVVTGDLTNHGAADEFRLLTDLLAPLRMPVYLIPGNHDDAGVMPAALGHPSYLGQCRNHLSYTVEGQPVRIVAVDTTDPARHDGVFPQERADWLEATLAAQPARPTLIAMHHPPFATGIWWMDCLGIDGAGRFRDIVRRHPQVRRVICGHVHAPVQAMWRATMLSVCPSLAYQVVANLDPAAPPVMAAGQQAFQLHHWDGEEFVSNTVPLQTNGAQTDLGKVMDWPAFRERLSQGGPFAKSPERT
jgi:3',5'-cyclic AMP phosphodiesterase CpdA